MLWLRFPPKVNVPVMLEQLGKRLESLAELDEKHVKTHVLAHVVYSTNEYPRVAVHDSTDAFYAPIGIPGLSVCVSYLLPTALVDEIVAGMTPVSRPGPLRLKEKEDFEED